MKFLMTMMMTLAMTSAFAECKLNEKCTKEECTGLSKGYALSASGVCINPEATQSTSTNCADIGNGGRDAKGATDTAVKDGAKPTANKAQ